MPFTFMVLKASSHIWFRGISLLITPTLTTLWKAKRVGFSCYKCSTGNCPLQTLFQRHQLHIPRTSELVTEGGDRHTSDVVTLRVWRWRKCLGYLGCSIAALQALVRTGRSERVWKVAPALLLWKWKKGPEIRKKARRQIFLLNSPEQKQSC